MKFNISLPPSMRGDDPSGEQERLVSWLHKLAIELNVVLNNLGVENFSSSAKREIFERKENEDDTV